MPIDFPSSPSSGQRYDYLSKSWIWNSVYWASVGASGNVTSGQLGTPVVFSGNIASGSIGSFHLASGVVGSGGGGAIVLTSGSVTSGLIGNNAVVSGSIGSGQVGRFQISYFNPGTNLNLIRGGGKGYFAGGFTGLAVTTADKLTYSTDTTIAQASANLSQARQGPTGGSGNSTKGYFAGGFNLSNVTVTTADKITYVDDATAAQASANLSQARMFMAGVSEGSTKGYFAGGATDNITVIFVTTADKLIYSNDTTAAQASANLSQARSYLAGISEGSTKGYFAGGTSDGTNALTTADKLIYSTDTTSAQTSANLSQARYSLAGCSGDSTKGYFAGGNNGSQVVTSDKLTYANDTTNAQTSANLSQARSYLAGISEGSTKGYFAGGTTGTVVTTADKLTYSNDTTAAQTSANLSAANYLLAGVDGGISPIFTGREIVASGKLTTTAANKIIAANFADNSVVSGNINSNSIFSVIGGYTPFLIRSVRSGAIPAGEIGQSHFARETLRSGNFLSGLLRLPDLLGDQIRSGNIGTRELGQIHFAAPPAFLVTSSMIGSGSLDPSTNFAQTAGLNTNQPFFDYFRAGELISGGIRAVCIASGSLIRRAECGSGLRLPAIGVVYSGILSGQTGIIYTFGNVRVPGLTLVQSSGLNNGISGFQGQPLYVGSGGRIVNQSGFWVGGVQQPPFLSGNMQQQIGIAISGGIFVMPSPRITRSGFQGTLPYDI